MDVIHIQESRYGAHCGSHATKSYRIGRLDKEGSHFVGIKVTESRLEEDKIRPPLARCTVN